ncbi:hydantoinase/oxoprolinase N-terminal domain-containing protein [Ornithinibacillus sp. 4-3]|uniref:Hydantoinase/oxoprolinase N-terminal domain-containing protein n=1 Tax=Ornithinibacillus sp. 4-3 TaxID=3231488 RepID=A0AB39HQ89_9BACI
MGIYRLGIDVGGTHTDAVILDKDNTIIATTKSPTTDDVATGINEALKKVVNDSGIAREKIKYAMLGTTHCTNAIVERKRLNKIAIIRIGAPATLAVKPLVGVAQDLSESLGKYTFIVRGGHEFDGREIVDLDEEHLYEIAEQVKGKVDSIAITSVFSPVSQAHENKAYEIMRKILGEEISISISSEIGSVGLLERENATILNAAVIDVAKTAADGFVKALHNEGIQAKVFFGQNDGTLMSVEYAVKYPIFTVACGPTNSLRGASYLSDLSDAIVVDVGGTTSDVGVLVQSFPRESSIAVELGGARTNFRMPDLFSIGLGGGTIIRIKDDGSFTIGPDSVGYNLSKESLIFGGTTLTATDVVVGLGKAQLGDPAKVSHMNQEVLNEIYQSMVELVEEAIDRMKTSADPVPVILVGGGSILLPEKLEGASKVIRPEHSGVANAIGSAIAQVSGQIEKIYVLEDIGREKAVELAKEMAKQEAITAGADPDRLVIVDIEDVPLAYLPGNATRIRVKAAGDLKGIE